MEHPQHDEPTPQSDTDASLLHQQEAFHVLMQECQECRKDLEPHWQFCAHCGVRLATSCPGCGNPLPPAGAYACPRCGLQLPPS